jgi:DNA modification methylase
MNKIEFGDCREIMKKWAEDGIKVQTVVTSPPYYGLRDYGVDGQIGLEQTPESYVQEIVKTFSYVWDILSDDGTLWLNIGDSYASNGCYINAWLEKEKNQNKKHLHTSNSFRYSDRKAIRGGEYNIKKKDLIGIPWRVAFALQEFGWYLRQDIIWHKPNPMPESVMDRCTKAHEYIFLLTKKPKYYFDSVAIKEKGVIPAGTKGAKGSAERQSQSGVNARPPEYKIYDGMRNKRSVWTVTTKPYKGAHFATFPKDLIEPCIKAGSKVNDIVFDPFMGSGTTAQVAKELGRQYLGCELNKDYEILQKQRLGVDNG